MTLSKDLQVLEKRYEGFVRHYRGKLPGKLKGFLTKDFSESVLKNYVAYRNDMTPGRRIGEPISITLVYELFLGKAMRYWKMAQNAAEMVRPSNESASPDEARHGRYWLRQVLQLVINIRTTTEIERSQYLFRFHLAVSMLLLESGKLFFVFKRREEAKAAFLGSLNTLAGIRSSDKASTLWNHVDIIQAEVLLHRSENGDCRVISKIADRHAREMTGFQGGLKDMAHLCILRAEKADSQGR